MLPLLLGPFAGDIRATVGATDDGKVIVSGAFRIREWVDYDIIGGADKYGDFAPDAESLRGPPVLVARAAMPSGEGYWATSDWYPITYRCDQGRKVWVIETSAPGMIGGERPDADVEKQWQAGGRQQTGTRLGVHSAAGWSDLRALHEEAARHAESDQGAP